MGCPAFFALVETGWPVQDSREKKMSHFSVIVIGPNVDEQLAPYHEFECSGLDDEYVIDLDKTDEVREEYEKDTKTMCEFVDSPGSKSKLIGNRVDAYDDMFYRDPTKEEIDEHGYGKVGIMGTGSGGGISWHSKDWGDGRGYRAKVREVPDVWKEVEVPSSEAMTFLEYIIYNYGGEDAVLKPDEEPGENHKYSRIELDENGEVARYIDRTNPNKKWDWYVVGGRWTGFFPLKPDAGVHAVGRPGLMTAPAEPGTADQVRLGDVDFDKARGEASAEAHKNFDKWEAAFTEHGKPIPWSYFREKSEERGRDEARAEYNAQPAIKEMKGWGCPVDAYGFDRDVYIEKCRHGTLVPYAIVKDGKWHQKGEMGWFGMSRDEKDQGEWNEEVFRLFNDLPDDTLLTIVDCHI